MKKRCLRGSFSTGRPRGPYYGVVGEVLASYSAAPAKQKHIATGIAIAIEKIVGKLKRSDWTTKEDAVKDMQNAIDDYLFEACDNYAW